MKTLSNVEAGYLRDCKESQKPVQIFLVNGVKLSGLVTDIGDDALILVRNEERQLVWYHSMATITAKLPGKG